MSQTMTSTYPENAVYMHPYLLSLPTAAVGSTAPAPTRRASPADVCDLLAAAGPLSLRDVAGGLDVTVPAAASLVESMLSRGSLRMDEWSRLRAVGACAAAA